MAALSCGYLLRSSRQLNGAESQLAVTGESAHRAIPMSSPGFPAHREIPVSVNPLSNSIFSIQPKERLSDGEYMIVLGPVAASGFEFGVHCLEKSGPAKVR
jgi:hypothetical protein